MLLFFKIRVLKSWKKSITSKNFTVTFYETLEEAPWLLKLDKPKNRQNFSKPWKNLLVFPQKKCKTSRCWNHSITTKNCAVTYYQTIEWVPWHLGLIKLEKWQIFRKLEKIVKICKICLFLASACSSVASHQGEGGGGVHLGADGGGNS